MMETKGNIIFFCFMLVSQFQNYPKASHRRKPVSKKGAKILDSATLHCVSGFRRNYNNALLKLALVFIFSCTGCAHGPVRHHTLGYYKYAGLEFTKRSSLPVIPIALITGFATDAVLIVADTAVTPVAAWIIPGVIVKVSPDEETTNMANLLIPTYPFTLANIGAMGLGSGTKDEYEEIFGYESSLFQAGISDRSAGKQESP